MTFLNKLWPMIAMLSLIGCTSKVEPDVIYKTKYVTVEVPVVYPIEKPLKPIKSKAESIPSYLNKVLIYTRALENIIDEHNIKRSKECATDTVQ